MKTVRIIKGTYGHRPAPGKSTQPIYMGKTVELPDKEADRLVKLRVAEYVAVTFVATALTGDAEDDAGEDPPVGEIGAEGNESGGGGEPPERPEYSTDMKVDELRDLMEEAGLQFRVGMKKADMVAALDRFYDSDEDGEQPPDLQPEAPVI